MPGTQRQSPDNRFLALYRYEDHVMKLFILQIGTNRVISGRGRHHYRHGTAESTFEIVILRNRTPSVEECL